MLSAGLHAERQGAAVLLFSTREQSCAQDALLND